MDWRLKAGIQMVLALVPGGAPTTIDFVGRKTPSACLARFTASLSPACSWRCRGRYLACTRRGSGRPLPAPPPPAPATAQGDRPAGGCGLTGEGRSFSVGPGKRHAQLGDVPFETLRAGDTVQVFWRPEPYREKLMLSGQGTATKPIRICGVPGPAGQLPVLDGRDATTRRQLDFPYQDLQARGVVTIGHPHQRPWAETPRHILFEGLEVRNGAPPHQFTDRAGKRVTYASAAAGVFIERGRDITIRGCVITENNNGIVTASGDEEAMLSRDVLIEANDIYANGSLADDHQHNVYNEAVNVTYQFNRFGSPARANKGSSGPTSRTDRLAS